ncbi:peroxisomal biogenesis factor 1 [Dictyostelium discoideum AX4]|uniref:Peroxisomal ATPase PEX1 n=1 Tax=Dictyostelium discoideum TaxID=44689 RepID=PEX1_DICDI|nr:peroxisomal biogenesis factor 1 [Dictyostelium discoideum AX4]Q54GX5.1 RecName: Full=Peroxisomal ATPase PEX1; AltName: Full=Peroxin-1; AltName: Full=Peroxisome biogenesis factor 1 [Dictyostelium discoideum]EAL62534.1 peroxisomal biogenesis factor 1 [Dictyostelium discoideum AX4]|eukprot:XP_636032.1 peroxisomal biogenesis factor 1 [Dictyostelium discoideum AX4]
MELHVQLKHSTDCFVSLPPKIVHSLLLLSEKQSKSLGTLGLEITWYDKINKKENKGYVGWAGGSTDPRFTDSIEMSQEMAQCLGGIKNEQKLKLKALNNIELAHSVQVEPLTSDDWEIMEVHQQYLEEQLLNQVNILYSGQIVPIWIHHKTIIKLKVTETLPTPVVKLSSNSEIIVAPKPRNLPTTTTSSQQQQISKETLKPRFLQIKDFKIDYNNNNTFINEIYINKELLNQFQWNIGDIIEISKVSKNNNKNNKKEKNNNGGDEEEDDDDNEEFDDDDDDDNNNNEDDTSKLQKQLDNKNNNNKKNKKNNKTIYARVFINDKSNNQQVLIHRNIRTIGNFYINTIVRLKYTTSHSLPICPIGSILVKQVIWKQNSLSNLIKQQSSQKIYSVEQIKEQIKVWSNNNLSNNQRYPLLNGSIVSINSNLDLSFNFNNLTSSIIPPTSSSSSSPSNNLDSQRSNNNNNNINNDQLNDITNNMNNPYLSSIQQIGDIMSNLNTNNNQNNQNNNSNKLMNQFQMNNGIFMLSLEILSNDKLLKIESGGNNSIEKKKSLEDYNEIGDRLFQRIGGMEKQIKQAKEFLSLYMYKDLSVIREQLNTPGVNGMIIAGSHGSGKSLLATSLGGYYSTDSRSNAFIIKLDCNQLKELKVENIRKQFNKLFYKSCKESGNTLSATTSTNTTPPPIIIILESLDLILGTPNDQDPGSKIRCEQLVSHIKSLCFKYQNRSSPIVMIATVISSQSLCQSIQIPELFGLTIELQAPTREERVEILERYLKYQGKQLKDQQSLNLMKFSASMEGYLGCDVEQIVDRSIHLSSIKEIENNNNNNDDNDDDNIIEFSIIEKAKEGYTPITLKGIKLHSSEIKWQDIGGLDSVRAMLKETIEWPTKYPKLFQSSPLRLRSGILLYGPTGCGKTLLASAIAGECGLNFISVKGPELLNKYIGSSEQGVRDVFSRASSAKPCVLFFDEFDSIAPRRGHDNSGVTDRVVNQFLTQLDGVEGLTGVYVLAATSRPDLIDPALLRPGRLDKSLYCNIPEFNERLDILTCLKSKMNLSPSISLEQLSTNTQYYTGADLRALMYNAQLKSIHEWMNHLEEEKKRKRKEKEDQSNKNSSQQQDDFIIFQPKNNDNSISKSNLTFEEKTNLQKQIDTIKSQFINSNTSTLNKSNLSNEQPPLITQSHIDLALKESSPSISESERKKYERIYNNFLKERGSVTGNKKEGVPKQTLA